GIPFLTFKGPVAAAALYGDVGLRSFLDLDILVPPAHALRTADLFRRLGYTPLFELRTDWQRYYFRTRGEMMYSTAKPSCTIDLHWHLLPPGYRFTSAPEDLWRRCGQVRIGGALLPTLSAENTLMFFALHAAKHDWRLLRWICDLAQVL